MKNNQIKQIIPGFLLVLVLVLCCGCPQPAEEPGVDVTTAGSTAVQPTDSAGQLRFSNDSIYPIPLTDRPYQDTHPSAHQAWFLVETAYFVVKDKYLKATELLASDDQAERERGSAQRQKVIAEIDQNIFLVNSSVEELFLEAIEAEPENPLNHASYAFYLKPRRRAMDENTVADTESEALAQIDRAIELWPDEASFYMLKVNILVDAHQCHDWLRSQLAQQLVIHERLELVKELLTEAEKYHPGNHYINYRKVLLMVRYTPPEEFHTIRAELLEELHKGNQKPDGYFNFPPPLPAYPTSFAKNRLIGNETKAKYVDQWNFFGRYDPRSISMIVEGLRQGMTWPEDKDEAAELMYFLYQVGRTRPYDRSMFSLQLKVLNPLLEMQTDKSGDEAKALAETLRFLNHQYLEVANSLYAKKLIIDTQKLDVRGINEVEIGGSHMKNVKITIQGPHASFLQRAGEILGIDFPLPENPKLW